MNDMDTYIIVEVRSILDTEDNSTIVTEKIAIPHYFSTEAEAEAVATTLRDMGTVWDTVPYDGTGCNTPKIIRRDWFEIRALSPAPADLEL